jgi:hypothetical protein
MLRIETFLLQTGPSSLKTKASLLPKFKFEMVSVFLSDSNMEHVYLKNCRRL